MQLSHYAGKMGLKPLLCPSCSSVSGLGAPGSEWPTRLIMAWLLWREGRAQGAHQPGCGSPMTWGRQSLGTYPTGFGSTPTQIGWGSGCKPSLVTAPVLQRVGGAWSIHPAWLCCGVGRGHPPALAGYRKGTKNGACWLLHQQVRMSLQKHCPPAFPHPRYSSCRFLPLQQQL